MEVECGQAGNGVYLLMKGGCGKKLKIENAYRCTGCGKWFHLDCIFKHFELEEGASRSHRALREILSYTNDKIIFDKCKEGLMVKKPSISLPKLKD